MLDKFQKRPFRLGSRSPVTPSDRDRIGVIRHRIASRLHSPLQAAVTTVSDFAARLHGPTQAAMTTLAAYATRIHGRQRIAVAGVAALAVLGLIAATVSVTAPVGGGNPSVVADSGDAEHADMLDRRAAAADKADRSSRTATEAQGESGRAEAVESSPEPAPDWVHPMPGERTTSCYGWRWGAMHAGVDIGGPPGTPIQAVGAGTVTHAGWVFAGYGISVVVDHGNGVQTHYAHASEVKVSVGDKVSPGDTIALEGNTGDSTGPHLHFEVHVNGLWNQVEPTNWMRDRGVTIPGC